MDQLWYSMLRHGSGITSTIAVMFLVYDTNTNTDTNTNITSEIKYRNSRPTVNTTTTTTTTTDDNNRRQQPQPENKSTPVSYSTESPLIRHLGSNTLLLISSSWNATTWSKIKCNESYVQPKNCCYGWIIMRDLTNTKHWFYFTSCRYTIFAAQ